MRGSRDEAIRRTASARTLQTRPVGIDDQRVVVVTFDSVGELEGRVGSLPGRASLPKSGPDAVKNGIVSSIESRFSIRSG